jgi:hypothetical protein
MQGWYYYEEEISSKTIPVPVVTDKAVFQTLAHIVGIEKEHY